MSSPISRFWNFYFGRIIFVLFLTTTIFIFSNIVYDSMLDHSSDYNGHLIFARELADSQTLSRAHALFQIIIIAMASLMPTNFDIGLILSTQIVSILLYVATAIMIYRILWVSINNDNHAIRHAVAFIGTLGVMLAQPIIFFTLPNHNMFSGYVVFNLSQTPTYILLRPFALAVHQQIIHAMSHSTEPRYGSRFMWLFTGILLGALCVLAKPNYALAVLPVLLLVATYNFFFRRNLAMELRLLPLIIGLTIMLLVMYIVQFIFIDQDSGIVLAPFKSVYIYESSLPLFIFKLFASVFFPLVVFVTYYTQAQRSKTLLFGWAVFGIALVQLLLFTEAPPRETDGNWWWGTYISLFILYIVSLQFTLQQIKGKLQFRDWLAIGAFSVNVLSGIVYFAIQFVSPNLRLWY